MTPSLNLIQSGAYRVCLLKQESGSLSAISVYGQLGSTECLSLIKKLLLSRYLFQFSSNASLWPRATAGLTLCWLRLEPHHEGANTPASDAKWREPCRAIPVGAACAQCQRCRLRRPTPGNEDAIGW